MNSLTRTTVAINAASIYNIAHTLSHGIDKLEPRYIREIVELLDNIGTQLRNCADDMDREKASRN